MFRTDTNQSEAYMSTISCGKCLTIKTNLKMLWGMNLVFLDDNCFCFRNFVIVDLTIRHLKTHAFTVESICSDNQIMLQTRKLFLTYKPTFLDLSAVAKC